MSTVAPAASHKSCAQRAPGSKSNQDHKMLRLAGGAATRYGLKYNREITSMSSFVANFVDFAQHKLPV